MSSTGGVKNENPGIVASDSLAGESINDGGSFAANSSSRGPMQQPARSLNANTTDTSSATTLDAAADRPSRNDSESSDALLSGSGSGRGAQGDSTSDGSSSEDNIYKPKGENLTEGGFDSGAPNASFNTDIGGKNDPGRLALNEMEARDFPASGVPRGGGEDVNSGTRFDALGGSTSA